jgi:RHS repeat-associated protein
MIFAPYCQTSNFTYVAVKTLAGVLQDGWDYVYDSAGNIATTQTSTGPANPATITKRSHNNLNQIDTLGGGGMTTIRGTLDEPGRVSVGITDQGDKPARMIESNRFEIELPLEEGSNSVSIAALDGSHNRSDHVFSIQVTARGAQSFSYDTNGKTTEFKYNALGQRCERIETDGTNVTRHYHLHDGITPIDRRTGTEPNTAAIDRRYFEQGEQRLNVTSWDNLHYCRDHLGSVREVVNSYGTLVARYDFDPYGKRITQYEDDLYTGGCDIGYTGHLTAASLVTGQTEMVLTHFRAYDPELGRWLSADPLGDAGGMNIYAYCYGNPLNLHDPDGMLPSAAWWGGFFDVEASEVMDNFAVGGMATIDGAIPFADPFQNSGGYDPCQDGVGFSKAAGGFARDVGLAAFTGGGTTYANVAAQARNPVLYELGSTTVSSGTWRLFRHTSVVNRGKLLRAQHGSVMKAFAKESSIARAAANWRSGLTPLGSVTVSAGLHGLDSLWESLTGSDCP